MEQNKYSRALRLIDQQFTRLHILNENNEDITNDNNMTTPTARWSQEEIRQMTDDLHPPRDAILDDVNVNATIINHNADAPPPPRININAKDILETAKQLDSTSAEGVDAWNHFHLKKIILHIDNAGEANAAATHNELLSLLAQLSQHFVAGTFNNATAIERLYSYILEFTPNSLSSCTPNFKLVSNAVSPRLAPTVHSDCVRNGCSADTIAQV